MIIHDESFLKKIASSVRQSLKFSKRERLWSKIIHNLRLVRDR